MPEETSMPNAPVDVESQTRELRGRHLPDTSHIDEKELAWRLAMSFSTFMMGVTYPSENDYPYEPFWMELGPEERLTRETFCRLVGLETSPDMVWSHARIREVPPDSGYPLEAELWNILVFTMRSQLGEVTEVLVRGEHITRVPYFLFGRLKTGALVGVRSIAIET